MLIRRTPGLTYSDVTPKSVYVDRRRFLQGMGLAGAVVIAGKNLLDLIAPLQRVSANTKLNTIKGPFNTDEKITPVNDVTHYNNFYEFGTDKGDPAKNSQKFRTAPWTVSIEG